MEPTADDKQPLREMILHHLMEDIMTGRLGDGEKLSEVGLARRFRVSRTPIREALLQLEKLGYVVHQKHVGSVVKKITPQSIQEIFEVIAALEGQAVESCVAHTLGDKDLDLLEEWHQELTATVRSRNYPVYFEQNRRFHAFFTERCGNKTLHELVRQQRERVYRIISRGSTLPTRIDFYLETHRNIIDAVRTGDPHLAGRLMRTHAREAGVFIAEEMTEFQRLR